MSEAARDLSHSARAPSAGSCSRCGSFELHRSHPRTAFEHLVRAITPLAPMRCPACGRREFRFQGASDRQLPPSPPSSPTPSRRSRGRRHHARVRRRARLTVGTVMLVIGAALAMGYYVGTH